MQFSEISQEHLARAKGNLTVAENEDARFFLCITLHWDKRAEYKKYKIGDILKFFNRGGGLQ